MGGNVITRETVREFLAGLESLAKMPSYVYVRLADINATIAVQKELDAENAKLRAWLDRCAAMLDDDDPCTRGDCDVCDALYEYREWRDSNGV